jgi:hypothetical protein
MRVLIVALITLLSANGFSRADSNASRFRVEHGRIVVAQSYCRRCDDQRTECVLKCNGAGACIQNCDNDYQLCTERACR